MKDQPKEMDQGFGHTGECSSDDCLCPIGKMKKSKGMVEKEIPCTNKWHTQSYEQYAKEHGGAYPRSCPACHSCFSTEHIATQEGSSADDSLIEEWEDYFDFQLYRQAKLLKVDFHDIQIIAKVVCAKLSAKPELVPLDETLKLRIFKVLLEESNQIKTGGRSFSQANWKTMIERIEYHCSKFSAPPSRVPSEHDLGEALAKANIEFNGKSPNYQWRNHMGKAIREFLLKEKA